MDIEDILKLVSNLDIPDGRRLDVNAYKGNIVGEPLTGRHGTFNRDFYRGLRGERMTQEALEQHTWSNSGYRLGLLMRAAILLADGTVDNIEQEDRKRLADSLFFMWSNLTRSAIENS